MSYLELKPEDYRPLLAVVSAVLGLDGEGGWHVGTARSMLEQCGIKPESNTVSRTRRVYLSGPMTGYANYNREAFDEAAKKLREAGFTVVSPPELDADQSGEWTDYMRKDIKELCDCEKIVVLPGWEHSRGASLEVFIATQLGMSVQTLADALCPF